jgi:hypothetical protein
VRERVAAAWFGGRARLALAAALHGRR